MCYWGARKRGEIEYDWKRTFEKNEDLKFPNF